MTVETAVAESGLAWAEMDLAGKLIFVGVFAVWLGPRLINCG
jgi:hypothetical protein